MRWLRRRLRQLLGVHDCKDLVIHFDQEDRTTLYYVCRTCEVSKVIELPPCSGGSATP